MKRTVAGTLGAALVVGVIGCGGGGSSELTEAQLVRQAEAICERTRHAVNAAYKKTAAEYEKDHLSQGETLTRLHARLGAAERKGAEQLDALEPPAALASAYDRYVAAWRQSLTLEPKGAESLDADDSQAAKREAVASSRRRMAKDVGMKLCN